MTAPMVMSYANAQDLDGDPGFTDLDITALQFVYGSETGVSTPSPLLDVPLLIESREFDLSQRWKAPKLSAEWVGGDSVLEPTSGLTLKTLLLSRTDGDISIASNVWLDFDYESDVKISTSSTDYSEGFHDVLILGNSVTFQPGESTASFEVPIVPGDHSESEEWLDVTMRPEYSYHYNEVPESPIRLIIIDA